MTHEEMIKVLINVNWMLGNKGTMTESATDNLRRYLQRELLKHDVEVSGT